MLLLGVNRTLMIVEDKSKKVKEFLLKDKFRKIVVIVGVLGIALIFFSGHLKSSSKKREKAESAQNGSNSTQQYVSKLEGSLKEMISSIKGAGNTKVLVTLESTEETVYATEEKKNKEATEDKTTDGQTSKKRESDDSEKKYITIKDADGTERALSVTQIQPTIKGVVVVCEGGNQPEVQQKITDAVKTALNITSKKVYVTK